MHADGRLRADLATGREMSRMSESSTPTTHSSTAAEHYQQGRAAAEQELERLAGINTRLVWFRTICFFAAAIGLVVGYFGDYYQFWLLTGGWIAATLFLVAIVRHEHLRLAQLSHRSDQRLFEHLLARTERNWSALPSENLLPEFTANAYADDLDLAGDAGLLTWFSLAGTHPGKRTLQAWLTEPARWEQIEQRQSAIRPLVSERDLRLEIVKTIRASGDAAQDVYDLPAWGRTENWLPKHIAATLLSFVGPALIAIGAVTLYLAGGNETNNLARLDPSAEQPTTWLLVGLVCLASGCLVNILVTVFWGSWIHDIFLKVTGEHRAVYRYADVFGALGRLPRDGGTLDEIRSVATEQAHCAKVGFAKLTTLVRLANFQRDPLLYVVYLVLQLTMLWDFRVLWLLERWKDQFGQHVDDWFDALGRCEALICGATVADEYPEWCFPASPESEHQIMARAIAHPLLPDAVRVPNDLDMDQSCPLLLVTGSNMAGKSTFMRAVGLNVLLARTGSPVCATRLECPAFELATSIRVRDSLRDGVSFFMAELKRLKEVVDLAQATAKERAAGQHRPRILFLLDEVLQGTNSRERQIAVASVLEKLLKSDAMGLVSTHDLDLAAAPEIQSDSQVVHFREYFETVDQQEVMRFDYLMRAGPTPTTNALKLLALVGLQEDAG